MDGNYFVKITTQAREQMREIVRYIASALQAPDTALRILDAFDFWIDETEHKVQVTAVVYGRRAQIKQLSQMSP
jgi:toxin ParE1/3/4